ncbi:MAG: hypothetical protein V4495_04610 [Pseudomonadota bacterium]
MQFTLLVPLWVLIKRHPYLTAIWATITYVSSAEYFGIAILEAGIPCLIYACIRCALNWRKTEVRSKYLFLIALVLLSSSIVMGIQMHRSNEARAYADHIVAKLLEYQHNHGNLPVNLDDIPELAGKGKRPHMLIYSKNKGEPFLYYADTFMPFEGWHYDFKDKLWVYVPD